MTNKIMDTSFCKVNSSTEIWESDGFNRCYFETTSNVACMVCLVIGWVCAFYSYMRNHLRLDQWPKAFFFKVQLIWSIILFILVIIRFSLQIHFHVWYGYTILTFVIGTIAWPLSIWAIVLECHLAVNSSPTKRHSIFLLLFWSLIFISENLTLVNIDSNLWWFRGNNFMKNVEFGIFISRYASTAIVFGVGLYAPGIREAFNSTIPFSLNQRLLNQPSLIEGLNNEPNSSEQTQQSSSLKNRWKQFRILLPYLWPKKLLLLQSYVIMCIICLIAGRVANLFTPIIYKEIVNSLSSLGSGTTDIPFRWDLILIYGVLMLLQGGGGAGSMGLLNNFRTFLWTRVQQYTVRELQLLLFSHLHRLSLSWHLKRKTGEVLRAVDRGTNSVNNLLNYILFNIFPTIADISIAVVYFITAFNVWFGLIIFATMVIYLGVTIWLTEWRTKYRRSMNRLDNAANSKAVDSLLNFETVKYYGAEDFEVQRYKEAILEYQEAEWQSSWSAVIVNLSQGGIITVGLISTSMLCAYMISSHKGLSAGDYVLLGTYILQLYMPLNWFGTYYRMIQQNFIDMENMFELLHTEKEVEDGEEASDIKITNAEIEFSDVYFSYVPERQILKGISFVVPSGKTLALVGPTGSGKTTIVRLLFRFYDIQKGEILIDGQNIVQVTQTSLRKAIGVVPQDTVLFNNSIKYNIRYGRVQASDKEVEDAAQAAEMHDQIMRFPEAYESVVGERGLKLSGGEKQRVAIARTILKAPTIVLLDEATSALDTKTERQIQASLAKICANRTSLVVAHRLSTIIDADEIIVLKEGEIFERGTHEELLKKGGLYESMWSEQLKKSEDAENNGVLDR